MVASKCTVFRRKCTAILVLYNVGLFVFLAMFMYIASTSDQLGPLYSTTSTYHYGRGFAVVVAGFVSANVAAVSAVHASTRHAGLTQLSLEH